MNQREIEELFIQQALLVKRLLKENMSKLDEKSKINLEWFSIIRTVVFRTIEYSNVHILITEAHELSHIPRIGEHVNGQKVQDVRYRIEGQTQSVELELEPELRSNHHLSFDEAKTLIHGVVRRVSGKGPTPHLSNYFRSIYDAPSAFYNTDEKFISTDEFDRLFPAVKISDHSEGPDQIQRTGFWKSLFGNR